MLGGLNGLVLNMKASTKVKIVGDQQNKKKDLKGNAVLE